MTATVGGVPAIVSYAGAAPGFVAGVMQVNVDTQRRPRRSQCAAHHWLQREPVGLDYGFTIEFAGGLDPKPPVQAESLFRQPESFP